ncbi:hypothetical protein K3757_18180 (plasmid) [Sulfitobacter sp. S223]|uniref:ZmpA/ZmpB/ZmpC family metallo-endopeptidase-related protein n=1 Tax=Sulfitobacter sp. S223 TaxID=2867023 RepID=UPI0021A63268|nr:ZmpA/ZmpB/ZmpC family metallo-endopeptidase-related protein [Sulfitobacter sp. S223]UWR28246.1 hypothetical protein K3757_18180 [Sulfitobacter sp. S223]
MLDQSFALGSNIDATGTAVWNGSEGFAPIEGLGFSGFSGSLDGQGNTITGLTMNKSGAGMFALTNAGAEISNLNLSEVSMTGTGTMGALAALAINTTIDNVAVDGALGVVISRNRWWHRRGTAGRKISREQQQLYRDDHDDQQYRFSV